MQKIGRQAFFKALLIVLFAFLCIHEPATGGSPNSVVQKQIYAIESGSITGAVFADAVEAEHSAATTTGQRLDRRNVAVRGIGTVAPEQRMRRVPRNRGSKRFPTLRQPQCRAASGRDAELGPEHAAGLVDADRLGRVAERRVTREIEVFDVTAVEQVVDAGREVHRVTEAIAAVSLEDAEADAGAGVLAALAIGADDESRRLPLPVRGDATARGAAIPVRGHRHGRRDAHVGHAQGVFVHDMVGA